MIPGRIGMSDPSARTRSTSREVLVGREKQLGDGEVGAGLSLRGEALASAWRDWAAGCFSGKAATPTLKSPSPRTSSTSSLA